MRIVSEKAGVAQENGQINGTSDGPLSRQVTLPAQPVDDPDGSSNTEPAAKAADIARNSSVNIPIPPNDTDIPPVPSIPRINTAKSQKESKREAKAQEKAQEKARKQAEKDEWKAKRKQREESYSRLREARKTEEENLKKALEESRKSAAEEREKHNEEHDSVPALNRADRGSKTMSRKSFGFLRPKRDSIETSDSSQNGESATQQQAHAPEKHDSFKLRKSFSFGIGRKKSMKFP